jgi:CYTH domain-containing protein
MIGYVDMLARAQDNNPHDFKIIAKGGLNRKGGYIITMDNSVVISSFHENSTFNIKSLNSNQIRKVYTILILEFDGKRVRY